MPNSPFQFVIHRLRSQPFDYTVRISHFVEAGEWVMGVKVENVSDLDELQKERVAADLRFAASLLQTEEWTQTDG